MTKPEPYSELEDERDHKYAIWLKRQDGKQFGHAHDVWNAAWLAAQLPSGWEERAARRIAVKARENQESGAYGYYMTPAEVLAILRSEVTK